MKLGARRIWGTQRREHSLGVDYTVERKLVEDLDPTDSYALALFYGINLHHIDTVVSFGKRLSSNAYVSYERVLSNLLDAIRLTYRFTPRWSLRLQGGSENAADMFYTFTLD